MNVPTRHLGNRMDRKGVRPLNLLDKAAYRNRYYRLVEATWRDAHDIATNFGYTWARGRKINPTPLAIARFFRDPGNRRLWLRRVGPVVKVGIEHEIAL
jgi:hypothetical protein